MILVRDVFRMKFGRAKQVKEVLKEGKEINERLGYSSTQSRILTDLIGPPSYTLVLESIAESLADYENRMQTMKDPEWQKWYPRLTEHMESAYREVFNIVEF